MPYAEIVSITITNATATPSKSSDSRLLVDAVSHERQVVLYRGDIVTYIED